ncbi:MAG: hypothetical protein ACKVOU_06785 [Cytophagales bacterium]
MMKSNAIARSIFYLCFRKRKSTILFFASVMLLFLGGCIYSPTQPWKPHKAVKIKLEEV